jgi:hypothetical protein
MISETERWIKLMNEKWIKCKPLREDSRAHSYKGNPQANQYTPK